MEARAASDSTARAGRYLGGHRLDIETVAAQIRPEPCPHSNRC